MPVNLSIRNAPDDVVERLRQRANRNHRSLQSELIAIIEAASREDQRASPAEVLAEVHRLGLSTPPERRPFSAPTGMPVKVVDASALAALLFGEPEGESIAGRLGDARLAAPALLSFELANVCLIKSRRHPERQAALAAAFHLRDRLAVDEMAVDHDGVLALAASIGLTAYDASYLWLARRPSADLVTLDRQLAQASASSRE